MVPECVQGARDGLCVRGSLSQVLIDKWEVARLGLRRCK